MNYGKGLYGKGLYSATTPFITVLAPIQIFVYTNTGTFKSIFQTGVSGLFSVMFKYTEKGCNEFSLEFNTFVEMDKSDIVKIFVFGSEHSFFCGVVRVVPIEGSTAQSFVYSGFGFNDYFVRMNAESHTYNNKTIDYIVHDLLTTQILAKSPILLKTDNLAFPAITVTSFVINYSQISEVLEALKTIADSSGTIYAYGVDSDGYFFFRPKDITVKATLVNGKEGKYGIDGYEPSDIEEQKTKLFVLRNDGTLLTTITTVIANDIFEEKVKGPDLADADLTLWATGYLKQKESIVRSAMIIWPMQLTNAPDFIMADGSLRIISNIPSSMQITTPDDFWGDVNWGDGLWGGEAYTGFYIDDTLAIKEIAYKFEINGSTREITLGSIPARMEDAFAESLRKLDSLEISLGV